MHSSSGDYLLTGSSNGIVRIHPLSAPYALSTLDSYWSLSMHDNHYGSVSHLATTFDDSYLVSGGGDGNVFVYQANLPTAEQRERNKAQKVKVPHTQLEHAMYCIAGNFRVFRGKSSQRKLR